MKEELRQLNLRLQGLLGKVVDWKLSPYGLVRENSLNKVLCIYVMVEKLVFLWDP